MQCAPTLGSWNIFSDLEILSAGPGAWNAEKRTVQIKHSGVCTRFAGSVILLDLFLSLCRSAVPGWWLPFALVDL